MVPMWLQLMSTFRFNLDGPARPGPGMEALGQGAVVSSMTRLSMFRPGPPSQMSVGQHSPYQPSSTHGEHDSSWPGPARACGPCPMPTWARQDTTGLSSRQPARPVVHFYMILIYAIANPTCMKPASCWGRSQVTYIWSTIECVGYGLTT